MNKNILLVDDEPHVIRVLRLNLERAGYTVRVAANGAEALDCIERCRPDAMITDLQMPAMGGRELCETARRVYNKDLFLILVMTSVTAHDEREWVSRLPNTEFLEKPLSPRRLIGRLAELAGETEVAHG